MSPINKIPPIVQAFFPNSIWRTISPIKAGHINHTFKILIQQESGKWERYILQKLNTEIFTHPQAIVQNMQVVSQHLQQKKANGLFPYEILHVFPTNIGKTLFQTKDGEFWRLTNYFEGGRTLLKAEQTKPLVAAARAYAHFVKALADLSTTQIQTIIPDFHNGQKRWTAFETAVQQDLVERVKQVPKEIAFFYQHHYLFTQIAALQNQLPQRITHNDTKLSNVLLNKQGSEAIAVIDWDTIMVSTILSDFGDMVRTFCTPSAEDEADLEKVIFDREVFKVVKQAFVAPLADTLETIELDNLNNGALYMTYMQALRFFTDYLQGDTYYQTNYITHNLVRTRNQIQLVKEMLGYFLRLEA